MFLDQNLLLIIAAVKTSKESVTSNVFNSLTIK